MVTRSQRTEGREVSHDKDLSKTGGIERGVHVGKDFWHRLGREHVVRVTDSSPSFASHLKKLAEKKMKQQDSAVPPEPEDSLEKIQPSAALKRAMDVGPSRKFAIDRKSTSADFGRKDMPLSEKLIVMLNATDENGLEERSQLELLQQIVLGHYDQSVSESRLDAVMTQEAGYKCSLVEVQAVGSDETQEEMRLADDKFRETVEATAAATTVTSFQVNLLLDQLMAAGQLSAEKRALIRKQIMQLATCRGDKTLVHVEDIQKVMSETDHKISDCSPSYTRV